MIVVAHICGDFYPQRANIQFDQTLMVPALFREDMCSRLKKTHTRYYRPHTLLWASRLQVAECCPTDVNASPGPLIVNLKSLSIEDIYIKAH